MPRSRECRPVEGRSGIIAESRSFSFLRTFSDFTLADLNARSHADSTSTLTSVSPCLEGYLQGTVSFAPMCTFCLLYFSGKRPPRLRTIWNHRQPLRNEGDDQQGLPACRPRFPIRNHLVVPPIILLHCISDDLNVIPRGSLLILLRICPIASGIAIERRLTIII
jgi:hypothetical protein